MRSSARGILIIRSHKAQFEKKKEKKVFEKVWAFFFSLEDVTEMKLHLASRDLVIFRQADCRKKD